VPPDTIKQLGTGEAVVIQKSPHATRRVVLFKPGSPKPPGEGKGPELEAALRRAAFESMYPPDVSAAAVERTQEQAAA
jgi:hypothetical protein